MPIQLDYLVISNAPFTLQAEQRRTLTFVLPPDLHSGPSLLRPLLAYKVRMLSLDGWAAYAVLLLSINEIEIAQIEIEEVTWRGLWETFPGRILMAGVGNTLQLRLLCGAVRLADVTLWFRRKDEPDILRRRL